MTSFSFIIASLRHYRRIHFAVALGVSVATAVLTGALLVGDSMSGSLRDLTLQRLGRIDSAVITGQLFRAALAQELAQDAGFKQHFAAAEPAILVTGTLQATSAAGSRRATEVAIIGCRPQFWSFGDGAHAPQMKGNEVTLTEPLARELGLKVGDDLLLRLPIATAIPADSVLGEKSETSTTRRFKVADILPAEGIARFSLLPSQQLPRNAFVPLEALQDLLERPGDANAILVSADPKTSASNTELQNALSRALHPRLADYGVHVQQVSSPTNYLQIAGDQLVLPPEVVRVAEKTLGSKGLQPVSTYLANTIAIGQGNDVRKIPYSTVAGVDSLAEIGPLLDDTGQPMVLADDEIVLNRWAADDLQAKVGDAVTMTFYEPESTHGELRERVPPPVFKLRAIVDLEAADGRPTAAADAKLTPELPGVTDQRSIRDWELPFELTETIRRQDEEYWDKYRTTPKAFVSLATAKRLWPSRWGDISLLRLPILDSGPTSQQVAERLAKAIDPAALGVSVLPVRRLGLEAAAGTTPFGGLFLGFSFFLIAAALMLIALLFQLGIQQRASEVGTLAAIGLAKKRVVKLLSHEGLVVASVGATVGIVLGVLYAWLIITGLRTWWLAAISTPFLQLHVGWRSLVIGWVVGVLLSWLTIRWSIRRLMKNPAGRLLSGSIESAAPAAGHRRAGAIWPKLRIALFLLLVALVAVGFKLDGEGQAGAFFASGAAMLTLMLGEIRFRLRRAGWDVTSRESLSLAKLSRLNAARNPGRSTLTIGLVAAASFLIVAISAFRLETSDAGTGGFEYLATSDRPIHFDLNSDAGRVELGFTDRASRELDRWRICSLRLASGEDASCLNLYRPTQPRVLGVPQSLIDRGGFAWASVDDRFTDRPWEALSHELGRNERNEPVVLVVLDASTAIYSLHLDGIGSRLTIRDGADQPVTLQVVGLLKNSVLQGSLLMSEPNFLRLFPDAAGYRFFMIEKANQVQVAESDGGNMQTAPSSSPASSSAVSPSVQKQSVAGLLESSLADEGFDVVDAREQLDAFLAVQNTYLSTFQSLGAFGLLLGTIGLAVVQLRSVLERRGELALMRAAGFSRLRLVRMVVYENVVLLFGGLATGCIAAAVALIPQWAPQQANVPWQTLAVLLGTVAVVGLFAGWLATRSALRAPIVSALRGD